MPHFEISPKLHLGAHCSAAGGPHRALGEAQDIGATTLQLFTSNQKRWASRPYSREQVQLWERDLESTGMELVMSHDSYLINLGSANPEILAKSRAAFREEIARCQTLGCTYLNFHPGSAVGGTREDCLNVICESLRSMRDLFETSSSPILLVETMAGQGSQVGVRFEEIAYILENAKTAVPLGVCLDTCHVFAAGYDLRTGDDCERVWRNFDEVIGLESLKAIHCNDSQQELGSRVDRHASLGKGKIGWEAFRWLMRDSRTRHLPKYLETPEGPERWREELRQLRAFAEEAPKP